jgi:benzoyl-CoA reductase/2-hydroxyglutaryl-CoA dehydratase subunit BcrC/BadD/HgdB
LSAPPSLPQRLEGTVAFKGQDGSVGAVFPFHCPRALLRAFNFLPVEVCGPPSMDTGHAADHVQPYLYSIMHSGLSFVLSGGLDVADVLVVPRGCDSLQGVGSTLTHLVHPGRPVIPIHLLRARREREVDLLGGDFRYAFDRLEEVASPPPERRGTLCRRPGRSPPSSARRPRSPRVITATRLL